MIVTSYLFPDGKFDIARLKDIEMQIGKDRLVVDVSCRRREGKWIVAMNKWQTMTDMEVTQGRTHNTVRILALTNICGRHS